MVRRRRPARTSAHLHNHEPGRRGRRKEVREVIRSHLNYVVADTKQWEQAGAYEIDRHPRVDAFVKNQGLEFAIPYLDNGQPHEYVPDFVIRFDNGLHLILETKGYDSLKDVKAAAARRWVAAVNADRHFGEWRYEMATEVGAVRAILDAVAIGEAFGA